MTCYCGATDCPSCGVAQGYEVKRHPAGGYYNPHRCNGCDNEFDEDDLDDGYLCDDCAEQKREADAARDDDLDGGYDLSDPKHSGWLDRALALADNLKDESK